jgi:mono/diheme cytochrome c family protein
MNPEQEIFDRNKENKLQFSYGISLWIIFLGLTTLWLMVSCGTASSYDSTQATSGSMDSAQVRKLYVSKCAICHGEDGKLGYANSKDLSVSTLSREEVIAMIRYGKTTMPPQDRLPDDQVAALADFAMNLRKP